MDGSISIREFFSVEGSRYSNKDAKIIGPVLHDLANHKGLTAEIVVNEAKQKDSPLHAYFEWDDAAAAHEYRLETARRIMRSIQIRYVEGGQHKTARAFSVAKTQAYEPHREPRRYRSFEVLHGDTAFAANMMDQALADLQSWRSKYANYIAMWNTFADAFGPMLTQINEFEDEPKPANTAETMEVATAELLAWRDKYAGEISMWVSYGKDAEYVMESIAHVEETMRKADQTKMRDCLKCGTSFKSAHAGHRICKACFGRLNDGGLEARGGFIRESSDD